MALANPDEPQPRASLLYNLGLIEQKEGNVDDARRFFKQSLALREHAKVRAALDSLP
jgi:Tfp pilus assembly protein PilF